jgi:hypothetical protein
MTQRSTPALLERREKGKEGEGREEQGARSMGHGVSSKVIRR